MKGTAIETPDCVARTAWCLFGSTDQLASLPRPRGVFGISAGMVWRKAGVVCADPEQSYREPVLGARRIVMDKSTPADAGWTVRLDSDQSLEKGGISERLGAPCAIA